MKKLSPREGYKLETLSSEIDRDDIKVDGVVNLEEKTQDILHYFKIKCKNEKRDFKILEIRLNIIDAYGDYDRPCNCTYPEYWIEVIVEYSMSEAEIKKERIRKEKARIAEENRKIKDKEKRAEARLLKEENDRKLLVKLAKKYPFVAEEIVSGCK